MAKALRKHPIGKRWHIFSGFIACISFVPANFPAHSQTGSDRDKPIAGPLSPADKRLGIAAMHRQRGIELSELQNFSEAIQLFDAALQLVPNDTSTLFHRAVTNSRAGNTDAAIDDYTSCIRLDPKPIVFYGRGNLYYRQAKYIAAHADYSRALDLDPNLVSAYVNRGNSAVELGKLDAALEDYNSALKLDPRHVSAYRNRGLVHASRGRLDLARKDYEQGIEIAPNNKWLLDALKAVQNRSLDANGSDR